MKKLCLLLALLVVLGGEVWSQYQLVCIGSSTTAGTGAKPVDSSWVNRVDHYYRKELKVLDTTYTLAIGGYPCYKGMPDSYVPPHGRDLPDYDRNVSKAVRLLDKLVMPSKGVVIINFPSNGYVTFSISEVLYCLQTMYDSVTRKGHRCYVTTTQVRTDGDFGKSATKRKMAILKDSILQRFGANAINFYDGTYNPADTTILPEYASGDRIHLNNRGYRELFERVRAKHIFGEKTAVELASYSSSLENGVQQLCWSGSGTGAAGGFRVQRSRDNVHFDSVGYVPFIPSEKPANYCFRDDSPLPERSYYRISIATAQGLVVSRPMVVNNPKPGIRFSKVGPVTSSQVITVGLSLALPYQVTCSIMSATGVNLQRSQHSLPAGDQVVSLPLQFLPPGQYFVKVLYGDNKSMLQSFFK